MTRAVPIQWKPATAGRLAVSARVASADQVAQHTADWRAVMTKLSCLGSVGGFCGPANDRATASVTVSDASSTNAHELRCEFAIREVSPFAAQALANVVEFFSRRVLPLSFVVIEAPADLSPGTWPKDNRFTGRLPFAVEDERVHAASGFDIAIHTKGPQPEELMLRIEDAYGHWFSAVNLGCFASETYPPAECIVYPGDETVIEADSIRLSIDRFLFLESEGIDSLLSVLQWAHERIAEIARVEIYQ